MHYKPIQKIKHVSSWEVPAKVKDFSKVGKNVLNTTGNSWPLKKINIFILNYLGIEIKSISVLATNLIDIDSPMCSVFNIH